MPETTVEYIIKYNGDIGQTAKKLELNVELLNNSYAILSTFPSQVNDLLKIPQIEYIEPSTPIALMDSQSIASSCISSLHNENLFNLTGKGVLIAILDSGIDYTHPDFIYSDGKTRIVAIWDQDLNNPYTSSFGTLTSPAGFNIGIEFTSDAINQAISSDSTQNLPTSDISGHGTAVAGIACGNNLISQNTHVGAAPESSILVVKLAKNQTNYFTSTTNIMRAVKYSVDTAIKMNMPLVINISYGNNDGPHDGYSLFEQFLDSMCDSWKTVICIPTGNEGNAAHHIQRRISSNESIPIQFNVRAGLTSLPITLYKHFVDVFEFQISDSSGNFSNTINLRQPQQNVVVGKTQITINVTQPAPYSDSQYITFLFQGIGGTLSVENIWTITIIAKTVLIGDFYVWLPVREISGVNTDFINPSLEGTFTIPSTSRKVLSVGAYNGLNNSFADFSGRGFSENTFGRFQKPDIVAPGVNIYAPTSNGSYSNFTGTSFAAPHASGGTALLMQWGIVNGNDPFMYGQRLKAFLQAGARRIDNSRAYPNYMWGYGTLCVEQALDLAVFYNFENPYSNPNNSSINFDNEIENLLQPQS